MVADYTRIQLYTDPYTVVQNLSSVHKELGRLEKMRKGLMTFVGASTLLTDWRPTVPCPELYTGKQSSAQGIYVLSIIQHSACLAFVMFSWD